MKKNSKRTTPNNQQNNETLKKVIILVINFIVSLAVYKLILMLGNKVDLMFYYVGISLYLTVASVLFCVFYYKNGFKLSTAPTPHAELPSEWSPAEKTEFLSREAKRTASAKKLLYVLLPMVVTVLINYIELMLPDLIRSFFG